jgi:hypothetical protein
MTTNFFTPLFCCCFWIRDPRSGIRDLESEIWDTRSGIRILTPSFLAHPTEVEVKAVAIDSLFTEDNY